MPLKYTIHQAVNLVYVQCWGNVTLAESMESLGQYSGDPAFRPEQRQLIDLKDVTQYERSYPEMMKLQARQVDIVSLSRMPTMLVYHAPTPMCVAMARMALKSWDGLSTIVGRIAQNEAEALSMLGIDGHSFADLRQRTA